ncbi:MAG TPA: hypothetical protein GX706_03895 [Candidatus Moranbacteria bacterium]|nr:hypothetical protein [Candidatus Moranbacteria bacterium]
MTFKEKLIKDLEITDLAPKTQEKIANKILDLAFNATIGDVVREFSPEEKKDMHKYLDKSALDLQEIITLHKDKLSHFNKKNFEKNLNYFIHKFRKNYEKST